MINTTAKKPAAAKPAPAAPTTPRAAVAPKPEPKKPAKPEPKTLIKALTTGQAVLLKMRANGTKRSLPYYGVGSEYQVLAEDAARVKANDDAAEAIPEEMKLSLATARRFSPGCTGPGRGGGFDAGWNPAPPRSWSTRSRPRRDQRVGVDRSARDRGAVLGRAGGGTRSP